MRERERERESERERERVLKFYSGWVEVDGYHTAHGYYPPSTGASVPRGSERPAVAEARGARLGVPAAGRLGVEAVAAS